MIAPTTPSLRDTPPQAGGEFFFELILLILLILSIFVLAVIGVHQRPSAAKLVLDLIRVYLRLSAVPFLSPII